MSNQNDTEIKVTCPFCVQEFEDKLECGIHYIEKHHFNKKKTIWKCVLCYEKTPKIVHHFILKHTLFCKFCTKRTLRKHFRCENNFENWMKAYIDQFLVQHL